MKQKTLLLVVGAGGAGKSTLVRALGGQAGRGSGWWKSESVLSGNLYLWSQSPQEHWVPEEECSNRFAEVLGDDNSVALVIASRPTGGVDYLTLESLVNRARSLGMAVVAAVLDPPFKGSTHYVTGACARLEQLGVKYTRVNAKHWAGANTGLVLSLLIQP